MRGIGLLVLLMGVALMFYLMFGSNGQVETDLKAKKEMESQVNTMTGRDEQSVPVTESFQSEANDKGILVTAVTPGGAMDKKYGLEKGDVIMEIGPLPAKDNIDAKGSIQLAYARSDTIVVQRGTNRITLPNDRRPAPAAAAPTPPAPTPAPTPDAQNPAPVQRTSPKGQALDVLKKIESH